MSEFQYQNSTKSWCHQRLGLNLLKPRSYLGIIPKASQTKFHQIWITKSKFIHVQIPVPKWEKRKKWEIFSALQNGAIRRLQIGTGFRDYKSGKEGLKIGAALGISNWHKKTTNRGKEISNRGRDCKSVRNNSNHTFPVAITVNNETITNSSDKSNNAFNNYFSKVARNIQSTTRFSRKKLFWLPSTLKYWKNHTL